MGRKISHPVHYDERLNVQPFMSEGQQGPTYSLYAVISHAGGGPNSGHYYAHVKSASGNWYEMNDESVTRYGGAPTGMRNAYILFYMREQHQVSAATIKTPTRPTVPPKTGVIAAMKKRKASDGAEDDEKSSQTSAKSPSIGPRLPSPSPTLKKPTVIKAPAADPQAKLLKKKIAVASQSAPTALSALAQYDDDDADDDLGEKVEDKEKSTKEDSAKTDEPSSAKGSPQAEASVASTPTKPRVSATIPASSFYGSSPSSESASSKKRKFLDDDDHTSKSEAEWARTPLSPSMTFSSPIRKRHSGPKGSRSSFGGTPFSRLKGANNLHQHRDSPMQYGGKKKKRLIM